MTDAPASRKRFHRVGEVTELTGLEGHVLRYWETEFPALRPRKSRGGQRLYSPEDLDLVMRIRDLLHVRGYTIAGARRRLEAGTPEAEEKGQAALEVLRSAGQEIRAILTLMEANDKL